MIYNSKRKWFGRVHPLIYYTYTISMLLHWHLNLIRVSLWKLLNLEISYFVVTYSVGLIIMTALLPENSQEIDILSYKFVHLKDF